LLPTTGVMAGLVVDEEAVAFAFAFAFAVIVIWIVSSFLPISAVAPDKDPSDSLILILIDRLDPTVGDTAAVAALADVVAALVATTAADDAATGPADLAAAAVTDGILRAEVD
jgi:hypothetical protein